MIRNFFKPRRLVTYFLALVLTLGFAGENARVLAIPDPDFYSGNNILYYDPDFQTACAVGGGALVGSSTKEKIWNFLIANDLTPEQAAGLMGNMQKESNFIPVNWQAGETADIWDGDSNEGWGLVQWDGGRRLAILQTIRKDKPHLEKYTEYKYQNISEPNEEFPQADFDEMLLFLLDYMFQESSQVRDVTAHSFPGSADNEWERMKEQPTLRDATLFWERNFEVSGDINYPERLEQRVTYAQDIYDEFKDNLNAAGTGTTGCAGAEGIQELGAAYAWPEYHPAVFLDKRPAYAEAVENADGYVGGCNESGCNPGIDCGGFVTLLVTNSGHDPEYNHGGKGGNTATQLAWLRDEQNGWRRVGQGGDISSADLKPGDVAIYNSGRNGHTFIFLGEDMVEKFDFGLNDAEPGIASASIGSTWRAPMAGRETALDPRFEWFSKE